MHRTLSIHFDRSVSAVTNRADELEITVTPLNSASSPDLNATYAALRQTKRVKLTNAVNTVTFDLTPTYDPGLTEPIFYRIAWRKGYMSRIEEHDFTMPDRDVDFDDLTDLGNIITGENYLKEEDLGVPGRVARLDNLGQVVDGNGLPVTAPDLEPLRGALDQEVRDRQSADAEVDRKLTLRLNAQVNSLSDTMSTRFSQEAASRNTAIAAAETRLGETIDGVHTHVDQKITSLDSRTTALSTTVQDHADKLTRKADLVGGKVPTAQLPAISLNNVVTVEDEAAMTALTEGQVQPGDVAVIPGTGSFILSSTPPSLLSNWTQISSPAGLVDSVNGQVGTVVLSAADVGARPAGAAIPQADVTGLVTALAGKASTTALNTTNSNLATTNTNVTNLTTRVATAETNLTSLTTDYNTNAVKKNAQGEIASSLLAADIPRVDEAGTLRRKDGTIIAVSGEGGGTGGAVLSVNNQIGNVVLGAADVGARPAGSPIPMADVDGLSTALSGKASTTDLQATNTRVSRAEIDIDDIQAQLAAGGSGGEASTTKTTVSWVADSPTAPSLVTMRSPFGIGPDGTAYYDPEGALEGEAAYPYVSMYGNLVLRKLDPDAPAEPVWATMGDINALDTRVDALEAAPQGGYSPPEGGIPITDLEQDAQDAYISVISATTGNSPDTLVKRDSAGTIQIGTPTVAAHATTKLYVDDQIATRASTTSLNNLTTTVNTKASQTDLNALTSRVTTAENTLLVKADLDGSSQVPVTQIPTLPGTKVTGFNLKADLDGVGGKLQLSQVPTNIPQSSIVNLTTNLAAKADLVNGKVPNSQLPSLATGETYVVANRAALLALTSTQVQRGDIGVITDTADKGSYILNADDPAVWTNWVQLSVSGTGSVASVNGQTGVVVLTAADVQARPAGTAIPQADVTNLTTDLAAKAATTYVDTQVATRTTPAQVTTQINAQSVTKARVDYVATSAVTLSGSQTVDGVLVPAGKRILATGQAASSANGIYVSATGAWTRATDMADGSTFMPATIVTVNTPTNPGASNNDSVWQITTTAAGTVGTNAQNWAKVLNAGVPKVYTQGNGITIDQATGVVAAKPGSGILVDATGIRLDTSAVVKFWAGDVPAGNTTATLTHGLGTRDVTVEVYDNASGQTVLTGAATRISVDAVTVEFATAPTTGQYRAVVTGR